MKILIDGETFGNTLKSLERLRNELAERIQHKISIHRVHTHDICCGFLIYDNTTKEAVWTGDGFRTDRGGEGGAGYKSACALLQIYGLSHFELLEMRVDLESHTDEEIVSKLTECINENAALFIMNSLNSLSTKKPIYLR